MIEKKIRKFFNSISVSSPTSCRCCCHEDCKEDAAEVMADDAVENAVEDITENIVEDTEAEIEVTPEVVPEKEDAPKICDYVRFAAKTFLILASVLVVGKTVALLVDAVSGEDEDEDDE